MDSAAADRPLSSFIFLLGLLLMGGQAVSSLPAENKPFQWRGFTLSTFNDNTPYLYNHGGELNVGIGRGPDDQFTAGFHLDAVADWATDWTEKLILSSTLAIYTDTQYYSVAEYGTPAHTPWREDTGSLQVLAEKSWAPFTVWYGLGTVIRGDLAGSRIQNTVHDGIGDIQYQMSYPEDGYKIGPFVTGLAGYQFLNLSGAGWQWTGSGMARVLWDLCGILQNEGDALVRFDLSTGFVRLEMATGGRLSFPGRTSYLSNMYSSGLFFDYGLFLTFGDWQIGFGYAINPYGAADISDYPAYKDQNQEFHWSLTWGVDNPLPWALRFFP